MELSSPAALKMQAVCFPETVYLPTYLHGIKNPEEQYQHIHGRENLMSIELYCLQVLHLTT
jgi:hypothetical protein